MQGAGHISRPVGVIALLTFVLLGAWLSWRDLQPRLFAKRFGVVIENQLYRSGRIHPCLLPKLLDRYGVDDIVSLTYPSNAQYRQLEARLLARGIRIQRFPLSGNGTGDPTRFVNALLAIHDDIARGDQVLVQCAAGSERTGAVIYLYRTLVLDDSPDVAYAELLHYGHRPQRNPKLEVFLNANMGYFAQALAAHGIVPAPGSHLPRLPEQPPS
jgi:protein tyrosine/serine phosphatase